MKELYIRFIVLMDGSMIKVGGNYHWTEAEAKIILDNFIEQLEETIEQESNPIRQSGYQVQLDSLEIQQVVFH